MPERQKAWSIKLLSHPEEFTTAVAAWRRGRRYQQPLSVLLYTHEELEMSC
jgi:hypothetical protein